MSWSRRVRILRLGLGVATRRGHATVLDAESCRVDFGKVRRFARPREVS